jgi:Ca2+-binding RTX toxin-like protein
LGRVILRLSLLALVAALLVPVSAAQAAGTFDCRASAARVTAPPDSSLLSSEPVVSNAPTKPCSSQNASTVKQTTAGPVSAEAVAAATTLAPEGAGAVASAAQPKVTLPGLVVEAKTVQAAGNFGCTGAPGGSSRVEDLVINGNPISVPPGQGTTTIPVGSEQVILNELVQQGDLVIRRAIHIVSSAADVVLAEAIVGRAGTPCTPDPLGTPGTGGTGGAGTTTVPGGAGTANGPNPCPRGAVYDASRNLCVIRETGGANNGNVIIVGRPYEGPSGGTVLSLTAARKRSKSKCLRGKGPAFAVFGTNGNNRITGSNRADRIVLRGGRDYSEGGRGNDCIDGGSGVDTLSGALDKDHLIGGTGGDHLIGGSAADRLVAGAGSDSINAGFGKDYISAGSGNDKINVATAGPAVVKLDCGKGRDTVRFNRNEKRRARRGHCEKRYMIR